MKKTNKYEWVDLPSKGQCYPINSPLRIGKVAVEYLTVTDEGFVFNPQKYNKDNFAELFIKEKLVDKMIDTSKLVSGDVEAILLWLRRTGYGDDVSISAVNSEGNTFFTKINLSDIKNRDFFLIGDERGTFKYFNNKDIIRFKFLTNNEIRNFIGRFPSENINYKTILNDILKLFTVSINNVEDRNIVDQYIDNMSNRESFLYRSFIQDNTPSIENIFDVEVLNETKKILLPIDKNLFLNVK